MQEIWKFIEGYNNRYQVSNLGRVKSLKKDDICPNGGKFVREERIMKFSLTNGYNRVGLLRDGKYRHWFIHRLVAIAFIDNPHNKPFVNHINSIRTDNKVENLEWCTQKENVIHAHKMGRHPKKIGEEHHNSTVTKQQIIEIKKLIKNGIMPTPISKITGINVGMIYNIKAGYSWKHIKI